MSWVRKAIVTGSREWPAEDVIRRVLDDFFFLTEENEREVLVVGDCPTGADYFAREYANDRSAELHVYRADWELWGRRAGPIRNSLMIRENANAQACFGFTYGESRGTRHTLREAERAGLKVYESHI